MSGARLQRAIARDVADDDFPGMLAVFVLAQQPEVAGVDGRIDPRGDRGAAFAYIPERSRRVLVM
jgi:hypothetical protein